MRNFRLLVKLFCIISLETSYGSDQQTNLGFSKGGFNSKTSLNVEGSWFFVHPQSANSPANLEIIGGGQLIVNNIAVFNGIFNNEKLASFKLSRGTVISGLAVFGTSKITTPRGPVSINSALHFSTGSSYQFRIKLPEQPNQWDHLSGTNMAGTQEINAAASQHINGYVSHEGASPFVFPVGDGNGSYYPLTVRGNADQTVTTAWLQGDPSSALDSTDNQYAHNRNSRIGNLATVYPTGQWDWHIRPNGLITANTAPENSPPSSPVTISATIPDDIYSLNATESSLRLVGWNGSAWEELPNTVVSNGIISSNVTKIFSAISFGAITSALPVRLISFSAKSVESTNIILKWATSAEENSRSFEIQHSKDAKEWNVIGVLASAGESDKYNEYKYNHNNPNTGSNFYRLRMIDLDNSFAYSHIENVEWKVNNESKIIVYPNPSSNILKLKTSYDWKEVKSVTILNSTGIAVYRANSNTDNTINVSELPSGTYIISVCDQKDEYFTTKFSVIR